MIIVLSSTESPRLTDLERFDRLHAEVHGDIADARLDTLCRPGGSDHVWLDVNAARIIGSEVAVDPGFAEQYDAMIAYAGRSGWLDDAGTHVRAHVQPAD